MKLTDRQYLAWLIYVVIVAVIFITFARTVSAAAGPAYHVPVLMYHRILNARPDGTYDSLFVKPETLDAQMQALEDAGWHSITADELAQDIQDGTCPGDKTFVISVDDGALDGYTNGAPIWEQHGFRATFYVVVGKNGGFLSSTPDKPHFNFTQMRDLVARGHAIGSHTWSHASLVNASASTFKKQVDHAQLVLSDALGYSPRTFVYPYGSFDAAAVNYINARYDLAFTTKAGADESTSPAASPRIRVSRTTSPSALLTSLNKFANPC